MTHASNTIRLTSILALGLGVASSQAFARQVAAPRATSAPATSPGAAAPAGDRGLVVQSTAPSSDSSTTSYGGLVTTSTGSAGSTSGTGAYGGLTTTGPPTIIAAPTPTTPPASSPASNGWSAAETAAYQAAQNTIEDNYNNTIGSKAEIMSGAVAMQLAVPVLATKDSSMAGTPATLTTADRNAMDLSVALGTDQTNLATATYIYLRASAAVQLQNNGYPNAAMAMAENTQGLSDPAGALQSAQAKLATAQQAYNADWTTFEAQTGVSHDQVIQYESDNYSAQSSNRSNEATPYPQTGVTGWNMAINARGPLPDESVYLAAKQQIADAYATVANAPPDVQAAAMQQAQAAVNAQYGSATITFQVGPLVNSGVSETNAAQYMKSQQTSDTTSQTVANAALAAASSAVAAAASAEQAVQTDIDASVTSDDAGASVDQSVAQAAALAEQAAQAEAAGQALMQNPATAAAGAEMVSTGQALATQAQDLQQLVEGDAALGEGVAPVGAPSDDAAPLTSGQLEAMASDYDVTGGDVLSAPELASIYAGYSVDQPGSSVIQGMTTQVVTPSAVMTVPSTQVSVPSTEVTVASNQVQTPSDVMDMPSLQIDIPDDQIDMPSLAGLSTDAALCGR